MKTRVRLFDIGGLILIMLLVVSNLAFGVYLAAFFRGT